MNSGDGGSGFVTETEIALAIAVLDELFLSHWDGYREGFMPLASKAVIDLPKGQTGGSQAQ